MHVASSRDTCRLKTWGLAYLKMNFHPRIMLIYALLSLKCRKLYLRAIKTSICPSFRPSNARIFVKKHPSFARLFPNMGPSEELGTLQNGQKWFTWSLVRNRFPPFLRIIQTGREDPGGRMSFWDASWGRRTSTTGLWLWRRGAHWLGNQKWVVQMF